MADVERDYEQGRFTSENVRSDLVRKRVY